jgi:hypothetical protein
MRPGGVENFMGAGGCTFLTTWAESQVTFEGGTVDGGAPNITSGNALFIARDNSLLVFEGTTIGTSEHEHGITVTHTSELRLTAGAVMRGFSATAILARGDEHLITIDGSTIEDCGAALHQPYGYGGTVTANIVDSVISGNTWGLLAGFGHTLNLTLDGTQITGSEQAGIGVTSGSFTITDSEVSGNTGDGINIQPQNTCSFTMRDTQVTDNGGRGVFFYCNETGSADLGTLEEPGGNTLTGNTTNIEVAGTLMPIDAVGNVWTPSVQGASAEGTYEADGAGAVLEVSGGDGPNYKLGENTMRLAENPL